MKIFLRVLRGGCLWYDTLRCRSAVRRERRPDVRNYDLGFRPVSEVRRGKK